MGQVCFYLLTFRIIFLPFFSLVEGFIISEIDFIKQEVAIGFDIYS